MMSTTQESILQYNDSMKSRGQIQIIFGPMFSGKTTELVRRMKRYQLANYRCLVVKYSNDDRYDKDGLATHDKQIFAAVSTTKLMSLYPLARNHQVIGVDEGQFFPDIVDFCDQMAEIGKTVIVAALDGTFQKQGFGSILNLVPLAESVVKLNAVCMKCFEDASFTKRTSNEKEVEVIGGADKYLAVCRRCYYSPKKETEDKENTPVLSEIPANTKSSRKLFQTPNRLNILS